MRLHDLLHGFAKPPVLLVVHWVQEYQRNSFFEFFAVLRKLPSNAQVAIHNAWAEFGQPTVIKDSRENLKHICGNDPGATKGSEYWFREELFKFAPEPLMQAIIAHELAHTADLVEQVNQDEAAVARGESIHDPERAKMREQAAVDLTNEWRFEQFAATRWWDINFGDDQM